ncbi:hypothetical protein MHU86_10423 [Fragilaria crotonensis]|nr:hypothetical protein MHU86_10423 [Fragilaria crotonensis]
MFRLNALALCFIASGVRGQTTTTGCLYTMEQLITEEEAVTDYSVTREYVFCEGRSFVIGTVDLNNQFVEVTDTHRFFPVRPNMHVRCGETGARENSCLLLGGDVQVDGTNYFGVGNNLDVTNVVFEGFTFVGANRYSVYATKPCDITFIDCEWKDITEAYAPLFFDYYDPSALSTTLDVSFVGCKFQGNVYYGDGSYPALITSNGDQNHLTIDRCDFNSNDYIHNNTHFEKNSYLVESSVWLSLQL